ncbi:Phosphatidylinositol 5-phosphate 4-kinase type-2 alpha [Borealophlyctis nickersoniae]|nr:Phosphatidylinositol 5-phosphate 4-kinase type-2 alpha [Borealophlyctis nickersoniae]
MTPDFWVGCLLGMCILTCATVTVRLISTVFRYYDSRSGYLSVPGEEHPQTVSDPEIESDVECGKTPDAGDEADDLPEEQQARVKSRRRSATPAERLEPAVVRHFRGAVRAVLHLAEVGPEVAAYARFLDDAPAEAGKQLIASTMPCRESLEGAGCRPFFAAAAKFGVAPFRSRSNSQPTLMNGSRHKTGSPKRRNPSMHHRPRSVAVGSIYPNSVGAAYNTDAGKLSAGLLDTRDWPGGAQFRCLEDPSRLRTSMVSITSNSSHASSEPSADTRRRGRPMSYNGPTDSFVFCGRSIAEANRATAQMSETAPAAASNGNSTKKRRMRRRPTVLESNMSADRTLPRRSASEPLSPGYLSSRSSMERQFYTAEHIHEWVLAGFGRVRFTDHAPVAFRAVRSRFGYGLDDISRAIEKACRVDMSQGKSDAVFFATHDRRFLFKTLRGSEPDNLKQFLPDYLAHITHYPATLLPRYLGLYTFERLSTFSSPGGGPTVGNDDSAPALGSKFTVVLMAHVFDTDLEVHVKYDFKGSNVGRQALREPGESTEVRRDSVDSEYRPRTALDVGSRALYEGGPRDQPANGVPLSPNDVTLKELDFQRLLVSGAANLLQMGGHTKDKVMRQLEKDVGLLRRHGFMDYSLLVGVHRRKKVRKLVPSDSRFGSLKSSLPGRSGRPSPIVTLANEGGYGTMSTQTTSGLPPRGEPHTGESDVPPHTMSPSSPTVGAPAFVPTAFQANPLIQSAVSVISKIVGPYIASDTEDHDSGKGDSDRKRDSHVFDDVSPMENISDSAKDSETASDDELVSEEVPFHKRFHGGIRSLDFHGDDVDHEVYFIGLIDSLQKYNFTKWLERGLKKQSLSNIFTPPNLANLFGGTPPDVTSSASAQQAQQLMPANHTRTFSFGSGFAGFGVTRTPTINDGEGVASPRTSSESAPPRTSTDSASSSSSSAGRPASLSPVPTAKYMYPSPVVSPGLPRVGSTQAGIVFGAQENSVEEPGRYAARLVEFIGGIIV